MRRAFRPTGDDHARHRPSRPRRYPLRGSRRTENPETHRRDHQAVGVLRLRLRPLALPRPSTGQWSAAHGPRILRRRRRGRQRSPEHPARQVRRRLVLPLRQHLPALPLWLPVLLRASRIHVGRAGALCPDRHGRRHACGDRHNAGRRPDPEPARRLGCARHRLVCGRRRAGDAGMHRGRGRRRRGRPDGRALRQAAWRRPHHCHEPPQAASRAGARIWRDRHRHRTRRRRRGENQGVDRWRRRGLGAGMRRHRAVDDAGDQCLPPRRIDRLCRRSPWRQPRRADAVFRPEEPVGRPGPGATFPAAPDRPHSVAQDQPRKGLRSRSAARRCRKGLQGDGRTLCDQDAAAHVRSAFRITEETARIAGIPENSTLRISKSAAPA
ncbi:hypothetical protein RHECNPAF_4310081 [Rhizobium etli CNPAF512]|nr:hypothetical protein RHECNPAF_4310081 [Rhizobium etli CNPAF512]